MLYLNYAKPMENGYIMNFFADKVEDIEEVSNGKEFITKNGTNYGVPLAGSTVVITPPDKEKKTFILGDNGEWVEGISKEDIETTNDYQGFPVMDTLGNLKGAEGCQYINLIWDDGIEYMMPAENYELSDSSVWSGTYPPVIPDENSLYLVVLSDVGDKSIYTDDLEYTDIMNRVVYVCKCVKDENLFALVESNCDDTIEDVVAMYDAYGEYVSSGTYKGPKLTSNFISIGSVGDGQLESRLNFLTKNKRCKTNTMQVFKIN